MNIELKSKRAAILMFCASTVLMFCSCQAPLNIEEPMSQTDYYDFRARYYNPAQVSFLMVDSVVEKYPSVSPYTYILKNPIDLKGDSLVNAFLHDRRSVQIMK